MTHIVCHYGLQPILSNNVQFGQKTQKKTEVLQFSLCKFYKGECKVLMELYTAGNYYLNKMRGNC